MSENLGTLRYLLSDGELLLSEKNNSDQTEFIIFSDGLLVLPCSGSYIVLPVSFFSSLFMGGEG